jgi:hypothetical protein
MSISYIPLPLIPSHKGRGNRITLVPKLWLGNGLTEAGASAQLCSQAGAWEQEAKDLHPSKFNIGVFADLFFYSMLNVRCSMFDVRCSTFIFKNPMA